jgi:hypothetical protein
MSDALERLKHRTRPTVPSRDTSLSSGTTSAVAPAAVTIATESLDNPGSASLNLLPENKKEPIASKIATASGFHEELQTKQSTLRFEQGMSDRLQELCRSQGICREVLIEALFEQAIASPAVLSQVLIQAQIKQEQRQQIANQRRARSMMERFG